MTTHQASDVNQLLRLDIILILLWQVIHKTRACLLEVYGQTHFIDVGQTRYINENGCISSLINQPSDRAASSVLFPRVTAVKAFSGVPNGIQDTS